MREAKDCLGRPLKAGQVVTYPGRASSTLWVNSGVVEEVGVNEKGQPYIAVSVGMETFDYTRHRFMQAPRKVRVYHLGRVTITDLSADAYASWCDADPRW